MSEIVSVEDAQARLPELLTRVGSGEEIIIAAAGKPIARLLPPAEKRGKRVPGTAKGKIRVAPDFDAPLPDDILDEFYK